MDICEVCEAVAAGDIDLPEEVANDELDDLFLDVTTASPKKEDSSSAKTLRGKKKHVRRRVFPGPTAADIQAHLMQGRVPDVEAENRGRIRRVHAISPREVDAVLQGLHQRMARVGCYPRSG